MASRRKRKRERQRREASERQQQQEQQRNDNATSEATATTATAGGAASILDVKQLEVKQQQFLIALQQCGSVTEACRMVSISPTTHYNWLARDPRYKALYHATRDHLGEILESVVIDQAINGVATPVFWQGALIATVQEYDHRLQMRVLQRFKPEYREQKVGITNAQQTIIHQGDGSDHGSSDPADIIRLASEHDPGILDYIRTRALGEDSDPGNVCEDGEQWALEDGSASCGT